MPTIQKPKVRNDLDKFVAGIMPLNGKCVFITVSRLETQDLVVFFYASWNYCGSAMHFGAHII